MEPDTPTPAPARPAGTPLNPKEVLVNILNGLGLETTVEEHNLDGTILLHIATPEPGRLIGRHGQTLSQLQFLVNRILLRASADAPRVTIDCEHYRTRQRDDVLQQVQAAADTVRRWGEPVQVGPFGGIDRRAIHQHFKDDPEIEAISEDEEGEGQKKMIIRLKAK